LFTLSGLISAWKNFRDFREFDLFHENKTRKNGQNSLKMHKIESKMQIKDLKATKRENKTQKSYRF